MSTVQGGDISNEVAPRVLFVWDGLLAWLPPGEQRRASRLERRGKWRAALDCWVWSAHMRKVVTDFAYRRSLSVDIVTYRPSKFAQALMQRMDEVGYPYGRVFAFDPMTLNSELAFMPEVVAVYHSETAAPFLYGSRGVCVADPDAFLPSG